jgi:ubiquinone/menaquinone biosynthesis C-methylase UbiE
VEIPAAGNSGILNQSALTTANDIFSNSRNIALYAKEFGELYIASREKESRIYTDAQVAQLPETDLNHVYNSEWSVRGRSANRLLNYLTKKNTPLNILEVGCGNGWLSGKLAAIDNSSVRGIDINENELRQATRVFGDKPNIQFETTDLRICHYTDKFDIIVFAASIQYFPDFHQMITDTLAHLHIGGEIHILDSHFYRKGEIQKAVERTRFYYQSIGFDKMAEYYFHHDIESLKEFHYKILYNPLRLKNRIFHRKDPFPWICIKVS